MATKTCTANATTTTPATTTDYATTTDAIPTPLDDDIVSSNYIQIKITHIIHNK
jgi:hypothetical protein